jgi:alcohol dehydrogenase (cytochrome c)
MKVIGYFLILLGLLPIRALAQDVTYQRLLHSDSEPQNWLMYDGDYQSHRFSQLKQINKANVAGLRAAWVYQITHTGYIENAPIVADGLMYLAEVHDTVVALDPRTGLKIWSFTPTLKEVNEVGAGFGPGQTTRGVAILNGTVYLATLDDHLYALDAKTGAVRWNATVIESDAWANAFAITEAPMAIDGKIIVGAGGGEGPVRGFLDAYDAKTGKRLWRVYAVPKPGEPGSDTWAGESAETGGSTMWNQGSYDPDLNLLYFGPAIPRPITTAAPARATTCSVARCWRSMRIRE